MAKATRHGWLRVLVAAVLVFGGLVLGSVTASAATDGSFTYEDIAGGAAVTGYTGSEQNLSIPGTLGGKTVIAIADGAFQGNTTIQALALPSTCKAVGWQAFARCTQLRTITLNAGLQTIDCGAFYGCSKLQTLTIPDSVTVINSDGWYDYRPFGDCTSLTTVTIGSGLQEIQPHTFSGCTYLETLTLGNEIRSIGWGAFGGCPNLGTVNWNSKLTTIDVAAFEGNTSIQSITFPASLRTINDAAFRDCTQLKTLTLNNGLQTIQYSAFNGCTMLKSVVIPNSVTLLNSEWSIDQRSAPFGNCTRLETVIIGSGLNEIKEYTFLGSTALARVHIDPSVHVIERSVFENTHPNLVICSTSNTAYAKTYAQANGIPFELCDGDHRPRFAVTYNSNGAGVTNLPANQSKIEGVALILSGTVPVCTGYTFGGWATSAGGAKAYDPGASYTADATLSLYAVWTPITYTVQYNANGATGGATASSNHTYGTAKALTANGFTKTGYNFKGWSTAVNPAIDAAINYANGQNVSNLTAVDGETVNLYAVWAHVNKAILDNKITEAEGKVNDAQYTEASRANLQTALNSAKAVRDNSAATQAEVDSAVTMLQNAINALQKTTLKEYFRLWGKTTTWEKTPINWFLLIVCFGWLWMAF